MQLLSIPRVHRPSPELFLSEFVARQKPVILTGIVDEWPALQRWTPEYLREKLGALTVKVRRSTDGFFTGDPEKGFDGLIDEMNFADYSDFATGAKSIPGKRLYLQLQPLMELRPIVDDVRIPDVLKGQHLMAKGFWYGPGDNVSPLHFDPDPGILVQLRGRKKFWMVSPTQVDRIYPNPLFSPISTISQLDLEKPDFERFPLAKDVIAYEGTIEPGEAMFIPPTWWHQVRSLDLTLSVNFFFSRPVHEYLREKPYLRVVAGIIGNADKRNLIGFATQVANYIFKPTPPPGERLG